MVGSVNSCITLGVIPARFGSTRFPGKPLVKILGRPLLEWVIRRAQSAQRISQILVATDDDRIARLAEKIGVEAIMTPSELPSGTDRVWCAVKEREVDYVLNIQGDEPLITGKLLDQLVLALQNHSTADMVTLGRSIHTAEDLNSPHTCKIVRNGEGDAIYFSRFPIPYSRNNSSHYPEMEGSLKHIGIYGYKKDFLRRFCQTQPTLLEMAEGLEQLRALYLGGHVHVVKVDHESWGVDVSSDIEVIEKKLRAEGEYEKSE